MGRVKAHYAEEINRPDHEHIEYVTGLCFTGFLFENLETGETFSLSEAVELAEDIEREQQRRSEDREDAEDRRAEWCGENILPDEGWLS